mgnify:CR=1 FL=1
MNCTQGVHYGIITIMKRKAFQFIEHKRKFMTSYPLSKALITLCRDEMSERISTARTVTERKVHLALREK